MVSTPGCICLVSETSLFIDIDQTLMLVDIQGVFLHLYVFFRRLILLRRLVVINIRNKVAYLLFFFDLSSRTPDLKTSR